MRYFVKFYRDESGQSLVEYGLLMTLIAVGAIVVLTGMGVSVANLLGTIKTKLYALGQEN